MASDALNIDNLPADVIRNVIPVGQESIESMRLINREWNRLCLEHLTNRPRLPVIPYFFFRDDITNKSWQLILHIDERHITYFGVDKWQKLGNNEDRLVKLQATACYRGQTGNIEDRDTIKRSIEKKLARIFARCSLVESLELNDHLDALEFYTISRVLGTTKVHAFTRSGIQERFEHYDKARFINFIRDHNVGHMVLNIETVDWTCDTNGVVPFFTEAMELLSSFEFKFTEYNWLHDSLSLVDAQTEWDNRKNDLIENGGLVASVNVEIDAQNEYRYCIHMTIEKSM